MAFRRVGNTVKFSSRLKALQASMSILSSLYKKRAIHYYDYVEMKEFIKSIKCDICGKRIHLSDEKRDVTYFSLTIGRSSGWKATGGKYNLKGENKYSGHNFQFCNSECLKNFLDSMLKKVIRDEAQLQMQALKQ